MIKLITHNDLDAAGCGILAKLAFKEEASVLYCSNKNVERKTKELLQKEKKTNHDIYMTDISVSKYLSGQLNKRFAKKQSNLLMIDHHETALFFNEYEWGNVLTHHEDGKKASATSLFYEHLIEEKQIQKTPFLDEFVELIRLYDTWEWEETENTKAKHLNDLFFMIGMHRFEEEMLNRARKEKFFAFSEKETLLLEMEDEKRNRYIQSKEYQLKPIWIDNYKVGVVHAEQYHSELGNELHKRHPYLDMIVILNMGQNKISFRTIHDFVNVSKFAQRFGGGGHPKAAGCTLTEETLKVFFSGSFGKKSVTKDIETNKYNVKKSKYGTVYKDKYGDIVSVIPKKDGKWEIFKNKIVLFSGFHTFEEAEHFLKKSLSVYLMHDEVYIEHLVKKYGYDKQKLKSQFDRTIQESKKEVLV